MPLVLATLLILADLRQSHLQTRPDSEFATAQLLAPISNKGNRIAVDTDDHQRDIADADGIPTRRTRFICHTLFHCSQEMHLMPYCQ